MQLTTLGVDVADSLGYVIGMLFTGMGALVIWVNKIRRDNSHTNLQEVTDKASSSYVQNLINDNRILTEQLRVANIEYAKNATQVGALTTEVELLRGQVLEVKNALLGIRSELVDAHKEIRAFERELIAKDGIIRKLEIEKQAAIDRAVAAEARLQDCIQKMDRCN